MTRLRTLLVRDGSTGTAEGFPDAGSLRMSGMRWSEAIAFVRIYWKEAWERTRVEVHDHRGITLDTLLPAVERVLDALLELEAPA